MKQVVIMKTKDLTGTIHIEGEQVAFDANKIVDGIPTDPTLWNVRLDLFGYAGIIRAFQLIKEKNLTEDVIIICGEKLPAFQMNGVWKIIDKQYETLYAYAKSIQPTNVKVHYNANPAKLLAPNAQALRYIKIQNQDYRVLSVSNENEKKVYLVQPVNRPFLSSQNGSQQLNVFVWANNQLTSVQIGTATPIAAVPTPHASTTQPAFSIVG